MSTDLKSESLHAPTTNAVQCIQCGDWLAYYARSFWTGNYGPRCERCHRAATESPNAPAAAVGQEGRRCKHCGRDDCECSDADVASDMGAK